MKETRENLPRNVILWIPFFSEKLVMKDPGQIAEHLAAIGYNVRILAYLKDWNREVQAIGKVRLISPKSGLKALRMIGFPLGYYILRNGKSCDCLILYFAGLTTAIPSALFRALNRRGVCILKLDSNGKLYPASAYRFKAGSKGQSDEGVIYQRSLAERIFYRLVGELAFRIYSFSVDLLIIESPEARRRVLRIHPWLEHKLIVLPNGISQKTFAELAKSIRINREKKILFVGRVEYAKGVDLLIGAFARLKDKHPDWSVELVGEISPPFQNRIESLIPKDLEGRVILRGPLYGRELAERYLSSKIFCFASRNESFGISLVEAMYFGNAVISSDIGAARYILDYGNAGLIFESENTEQLAAGLDKLMSDEAMRNRVAEAARLRCEQLFNWEKIIGELDRHISSISARRRSLVHSTNIGN